MGGPFTLTLCLPLLPPAFVALFSSILVIIRVLESSSQAVAMKSPAPAPCRDLSEEERHLVKATLLDSVSLFSVNFWSFTWSTGQPNPAPLLISTSQFCM